MRRRTFCASTLGGLAALALPLERVLGNGSATTHSVEAVSRLGKDVSLAGAEITQLQQALRGPLLLRTSPEYDSARRVWNGAFDKLEARADELTWPPT